MLSTNYSKDTLVLSLPAVKPLVNLIFSTLIIILLRTSAIKVKRKGERGSPCLKPLVALTQSFAFPLTRIAFHEVFFMKLLMFHEELSFR